MTGVTYSKVGPKRGRRLRDRRQNKHRGQLAGWTRLQNFLMMIKEESCKINDRWFSDEV